MRQGSGHAQVDPGIRGGKPDDTTGQIALHLRLQLRSRFELRRRGAGAAALGQLRCTDRFNHSPLRLQSAPPQARAVEHVILEAEYGPFLKACPELTLIKAG
ncbi:MAG: hypothetical protein Tsb0019_15870 [Roseibium sp.]